MIKHEMHHIARTVIPMFMIMDVVLINFTGLAARLPKNMHQRPTA